MDGMLLSNKKTLQMVQRRWTLRTPQQTRGTNMNDEQESFAWRCFKLGFKAYDLSEEEKE